MKKNNQLQTPFAYLFLFLIAGSIIIFSSCDFEDVSGPEPDPDPDPAPADTVGSIPPDGILETVTWNLEWFGTVGNGPSDESLQTNNALDIIDSLKADLYAFQEISNQESLNNLTGLMKGYRGFVADHITYNQRTAFVYNTQTIDSISSGPIEEFQDENAWAGRLPFFFSFNYKRTENDNDPLEIYAVVIHAKASDDQESYQRRMRAAESLYTYLTRIKPDANIIFLGDYNDDVDESIYQGATTPYQPFVDDEDNFHIITQSLSQEGQSTTVGFPDAVDHITVSNEMEPFYIIDSEAAFVPTDDFIERYGETTSDHFPVISRFDVRQ